MEHFCLLTFITKLLYKGNLRKEGKPREPPPNLYNLFAFFFFFAALAHSKFLKKTEYNFKKHQFMIANSNRNLYAFYNLK